MAQYVKGHQAMTIIRRGLLITLILVFIVGLPVFSYRYVYAHRKRFRVVTPGKVYRSGQLTQDGFRDMIRKHGIKTIINLQEDVPDPLLPQNMVERSTRLESDLCQELGVRYVQISPDLVPIRQFPERRPDAVDQFLSIMDEMHERPDEYFPVLIHCRAGLHRTGCMVSIYRMEYENWSPLEAYRELKAQGFGNSACTSANQYVRQYVLGYKAGWRKVVEAPSGWNPEMAEK